MAKVALLIGISLIMAMMVPAIAAGAIGNRNSIGDAKQIRSESEGTMIWNFIINENPENEEELIFELIMESENPVWGLFEIIDEKGIVTDLYVPPVLPGTVIESLDDLTPIRSEPLQVGRITEDTLLTVHVFLFKDEQLATLYENGHIVTMLYGNLNCYQREIQCFTDYRNSFGVNEIKMPWGWQYNRVDASRPAWSYNGLDAVMSQRIIESDIERPEPVPLPFSLQDAPASSIDFGQSLNVTIAGNFATATATLMAGTNMVAVDQASGEKDFITFAIPPGPQGKYQPGSYKLQINIVDEDGNKYPYVYNFTVA